MEQKRVSFKVAKVIKEVGYPQDETEYKYTKEGNIFVPINRGEDEKYSECDAPTYLDVWLWLWREKRIDITCSFFKPMLEWLYVIDDSIRSKIRFNDPEEAIIDAIEYLVNNDLLK